MRKQLPAKDHPSRLVDLAKLFKESPSKERNASLCAMVTRTGVTCKAIASEAPGAVVFDCLVPDDGDDDTLHRAQYEWTYDLGTGSLVSVKLKEAGQ